MKKFLSWATLLAVLASMHFASSPAAAQQGPRPQIAVIDLNYIFSQHIRFKQMREDLRRDIEAANNEFRANRVQLQKMVENLEGLNRASPEYKQQEEDAAKRESELKLQASLLKRDFDEREARIWFTIYKEVMEQVRYYADKHGILLVLQFKGDEPDESEPASIQQNLVAVVLHHNRAIDITPFILDLVNPPVRGNQARQGAPSTTNGPRTTSRPGVPPKQR